MTEIQKASNSNNDRNSFEDLMNAAAQTYASDDLALIQRAYDLANKAHEGQLRRSGQPYIIHPVAVARILIGLGMDTSSVAAALLHDVVEDTPYTNEDMVRMFGSDIAQLVEGVTKLGKVPLLNKEEQQAENLRKMLIAMSRDIRVIIIKLADRLHNMRTLNFMVEQKRRDVALETLEFYAPIAHRLGIRPVKEELEDLAISYLDPVAYKEIKDNLEAQSSSRLEFLENIKAAIGERVRKIVPDARIDGRIKSVHGIYRKMYMQNKNFDEIYDIYAVRVIVNTVIDCYNCLGVVHDMYRSLPGRFKDYISNPKPNMYQSLHTTVISRDGIPFEVQIRSWEMHNTAEYGIAAHWKYKLSGSGEKIEDRLAWVRKLIESQQDSNDVEDIMRTIKTDLVPEEVFVFTPKGDVKSLPVGATVIDFAYAIHSAVGNRMIGAKVDGRIVPIDYQVKNGEIIDILTSSNPDKGPSRDWLNIVKTGEARSKIRSWFKKEKRDENIVEGRSMLDRELRRNNIRFSDAEFGDNMIKLAERYHCKTVDDLYAAIGYGGVTMTKIMPRIRDSYSKISKAQPTQIPVNAPERKTSKSSDGVIIEGIDNCLVKFARCCNPLPGDEIIGFITRGHGVSVHSRNCTNVPVNIGLSAEPDRWLKAYWDKSTKEEFKATLVICALDRVALLADITAQLAAMRVMISASNSRTLRDGRVEVSLTVYVDGIEHVKSVIAKLEKVNGILSVERT